MSNPVACAHGATKSLSGLIKCELLTMQVEAAVESRDGLDNFIPFWTATAGRRRLIDAELAHQYFGYAAFAFLHGNSSVAHTAALFGRCVEEIASQGLTEGDWFTQESHIAIIHHNRKHSSDDNLARFLAKKIPCSCLDEARKQAKAGPKMRTCCACFAEFPMNDLKICLGCNTNDYCSKECQIAHWEVHKPVCKMLRKSHRETSNETFEQAS